MTDQYYVYATAAVIGGLVLSQVLRKEFDPFAPIWLFLCGYTQLYIIQAISYRDYALEARGIDVVTAANQRALWGLLWFLAVYYSGFGKVIARRLPRAPRAWSNGMILGLSPLLIVWGLACAGLVIAMGHRDGDVVTMSPERNLLLHFPTVHLVAAILLIITGRQPDKPRPALTWAGIAAAVLYTAIWMFYGRRSHALFGIITSICAFYLPRFKRPSLLTLTVVAVTGCFVVALALGWRGARERRYDNNISGFMEFVSEFNPEAVLVSLNLKEPLGSEGAIKREALSRETEEYGGFLLMMDTVPHKSSYDYGSSYIRIVSSYIPRVIWRDKPYFGRVQWINAWIAGSEFPRKESFTGPAIGILGATQLNGGATATIIVLAVVALLIRTGYDYYRYHADLPWAQAWWSVTYFNAWLITVNDDPFVWFYYLYGHTILPTIAFLWIYNRLTEPQQGYSS